MTTDFLCVRQSFVQGVASIGNIGGDILYNGSESAKEADTKAIYSDWYMIGEDIKGAIKDYENTEQ